ncbi:MAG: PAS domain S-box protein [Anaerolineae bacterium]|nr:PAS domain S-box protein [Anaerolineae bacterium]
MQPSSTTSSDSNPEFEALLNFLNRNRGFDFTGYKRSSLTRRIQKRMQMIHVESFGDYIDYLEVHPEEFIRLFDTILINVTNFFRDSSAWDHIAQEVIPAILATKRHPSDPIRVWSAGCSTGEEAYTIAILLAEALGADQYRERVKIYASDVDEEALNQARQATYSYRESSSVPPDLLEKYFERTDHHVTFRKDLRRSVIFGRHDLVQDAPISRIDLLICRNVLMYFNAETQSRILTRFHFALHDTGFLFLGKAEMLFTNSNLFVPVDLKRRVFSRVPRITLRDRLMLMNHSNSMDGNSDRLTKHVRFREAAFDASPLAQVVVDANGFVVLSSERARNLLGLSSKDINRPLSDLEIAYKIPDLRSGIEQVNAERRPLTLREIAWITSSGDVRTLEVLVSPVMDTINGGVLLGSSITFTDISRYKQLQDELEHSNQELETAYEELQSTNEELETINEELQSTNEELQTINDELRRRTEELNQVNGFLESILASMRGGVVVVDNDLRVQVWNRRAEDLWGLRSNEVQDKNFLNLDIGLPVAQLRSVIRTSANGESELESITLDAVNRRGKNIKCKVTCSPLYGANNDIRGVILLMEEI